MPLAHLSQAALVLVVAPLVDCQLPAVVEAEAVVVVVVLVLALRASFHSSATFARCAEERGCEDAEVVEALVALCVAHAVNPSDYLPASVSARHHRLVDSFL